VLSLSCCNQGDCSKGCIVGLSIEAIDSSSKVVAIIFIKDSQNVSISQQSIMDRLLIDYLSIIYRLLIDYCW